MLFFQPNWNGFGTKWFPWLYLLSISVANVFGFVLLSQSQCSIVRKRKASVDLCIELLLVRTEKWDVMILDETKDFPLSLSLSLSHISTWSTCEVIILFHIIVSLDYVENVFQRVYVLNSGFTGPTSIEFNKIFIKTGSHGTIHIFKNYFTTVFSVFNNKRYPNRHLVHDPHSKF